MKKFLYSFSMICVMVFCILFSVFTVANTNSFYTEQYIAIGAEDATGMSIEDLNKTTAMLLDYLNDRRDDLNLQVEKWGEMEQVFDDRETSHMVDVKNLYSNAAKVMYFCLIVSAVILIYLFVKDGKVGFFTGAIKGYKGAIAISLILIVILGAAFTFGFNTFWTMFHKVVFTNDLWLLDPRVSTMINMYPLPFWLAMCTDMLIRFAIIFIAIYPVLNTLRRYFSK